MTIGFWIVTIFFVPCIMLNRKVFFFFFYMFLWRPLYRLLIEGRSVLVLVLAPDVEQKPSKSIICMLFSLGLQVEPSPTTGSLTKTQIGLDSAGSVPFSSTADGSSSHNSNEINVVNFEFRPHNRSSLGSGLSSLGPLVISS